MGVSGSREVREDEDIWWTNGEGTSTKSTMEEDISASLKSLGATEEEKDISLHQLSENLNDLKEKRKAILAAKRKQFEDLREEVRRLNEENQRLKSTNSPSQEEYTKELKQLQHDNDHLRLLLSSKQSGGVLLEELDKVLRENTTLKCELKDKLDELKRMAALLDTNRELKINIAEMQSELQELNSVVVEFEKEREEYRAHVVALKDVIAVSKKMLLIRESQLKELREKVESIEESLSGKEINILSQDLRLEYERQLQSIRNLRALYEDRQRTDHKEKEQLNKIIEETKKELESEQNKNKEAEARIGELEEINSQKYDQIKSLESNLGLSKAECRQYQAELTVINQLFSKILLGFNSTQEIDLDKLTKHLEDHRDLLQNIVINELTPESSFALPKILLDLVNQVSIKEEIKRAHRDSITQQEGKLETIVEESESQTSSAQINSAEEIVELLPKVWRVLIELLSHHKAPINILTDEETTDEDPCYKTVQTPKGPSVVLSVSQTFIRLKDLILEKKSLEKETGHLKQLNTHLETRLQDQEKRLSMVSSELNKTWHVVGKLQKQHQLLHTQEKILRYELAQKRKLLTTLKEELEYSRGKWQEAREKNSKTEKQWRQLRGEFAARRTASVADECNTSQESGYSDERASSSDDEPGYETDVSECAPASKQNEDLEEGDQISTLDNSPDPVTQLVDQTEPDNEIAPNLRPQEEPILDDNINTRVTLAENSIERANNVIESRVSCSQKQDSEASSLKIKETSYCIVSSVIEEAIASILQNADETRHKEPLSEQTEESKTENTGDNTKKTGLEEEDTPSESNQASKQKSLEEILAAKEERLRRLEGQCDQLVEKVTNTTQKSVMISNKLDNLHEAYGESSTSNTRRKTLVDDKEKKDDACSNNHE